MGVLALVITLLSFSVQIASDTQGFIAALNTMHQHTTGVVYRKALRPTGKGIKHTAKAITHH